MDGLKNYMETVVLELISYGMKSTGCCQCDTCKMDVAAIALNNLPPKYVAAREVFAKLNIMREQFCVDVLTEVIKAAAIVAKNPRHDATVFFDDDKKDEKEELLEGKV
jgi:competence protein ComFB